MSSRDLDIGLNIRLRDQASAPGAQVERNIQQTVRQTAATYQDASRVAVTASRMIFDVRAQAAPRVEQTVQKTVEQTARSYTDASRVAVTASRMVFDVRAQGAARAEQAAQRTIQQTVAVQAQANRAALTASQRIAAARITLDVRSEQTIRREIDQTIAAYNRLARAGFASTAEQSRAFAALQTRVADLRAEMRAVSNEESRMTRAGRGIGAAWKLGGAAAGVAGAAMVAAKPVDETMAYGRRLAMMANTAFPERDLAGRRQGAKELDSAIRNAVRVGGGSPDEVAETLDSLLASGAVSDKTAMNILPTLQKFATGTGSSPAELGNIAIRAMQNFGIAEADIPRALDMALKGGKAGGFELRDMSKWLPQQMAIAKTAGMSGLQDFGRLVVANQASVITAGTRDEAGNNLVNWLEKINSADTQLKAKHLGINLTASLAASRGKGVNAMDAFVGIVERVMAKDPAYQKVQKQLDAAPKGERAAILESQVNLLQGTSIGKLIHDRQALGALLAYMGQKNYRKTVSESVFDSTSAVTTDFANIEDTPSYKVEQAKNAAFFGKVDALDGLNGKIGNAAQLLSDYAGKYPPLMTAIQGTTIALQTMTAAIAPLAVFSLLRGGAAAGAAGAAGALPAAAVGGAAASAGAAAGFASRFGRIAKLGGPFGVGLQLVGSGIEAASIAADNTKTADEKKASYVGVAGGAVGGVAGMAAGAAVGAAAGSVVPGIGTAVGLVAGGVAGYFGHDWGEKLGKMIGDAIFAQKKEEKPQPIQGNFTINLDIDGHRLYEGMTSAMSKTAQRN